MNNASAATKLNDIRDSKRRKNTSGESGNSPSERERTPDPRDRTVVALHRQALEIIEEVLSGTSPEQAGVRARLRIHVARNSGAPERALLEHLMSR